MIKDAASSAMAPATTSSSIPQISGVLRFPDTGRFQKAW
jgi:hypothetical protein